MTPDLKKISLVIEGREIFIPLVVNLEQEQLQTELMQKGQNGSLSQNNWKGSS